jgi:hypothetical protein
MNRPRSITIIGWTFVAVGCIALIAGLRPLLGAAASRPGTDIKAEPPMDIVFASVSSIVAVAGGAGVLGGFNWARWLLFGWMGFHVILSAMHSVTEVIVHGLLFSAITYFLLRPQAAAYFRGTPPPQRS